MYSVQCTRKLVYSVADSLKAVSVHCARMSARVCSVHEIVHDAYFHLVNFSNRDLSAVLHAAVESLFLSLLVNVFTAVVCVCVCVRVRTGVSRELHCES